MYNIHIHIHFARYTSTTQCPTATAISRSVPQAAVIRELPKQELKEQEVPVDVATLQRWGEDDDQQDGHWNDHIITRWRPSSLAFSCFISPISLWSMGFISNYLLWFRNQLITGGGHHLVLDHIITILAHDDIPTESLIPGKDTAIST